jgi:hypothetical protein
MLHRKIFSILNVKIGLFIFILPGLLSAGKHTIKLIKFTLRLPDSPGLNVR